MLISHDPPFLFVHIQRTGGTTIVNLLIEQLAEKVTILSEHGNTRTEDCWALDYYPNHYSFSFIRNPWSRIYSWYALLHRDQPIGLTDDRQRFERFLEEDKIADPDSNYFHYNQLDYLTDTSGSLRIKELYRYENYEEECKRLFTALGLPLNYLPRVNGGGEQRHYSNFYTQKSIDLVREKCSKDILQFNYCFEQPQ